MKHSKKILALAMSIAVVASIAAAGTLAYLTATADPVVNTFTVGDIQIDLKESKLQEDGSLDKDTPVQMNEYKRILPGQTLNKDPYVTVKANSENCYLYVQVLNGMNAALPGAATLDIDVYNATENPDGVWVVVDEANGIYRYSSVITNAAVDQKFTVFNTVSINGELKAENMETINNSIIAVKACAIQAEENVEATATQMAIDHFMEAKA